MPRQFSLAVVGADYGPKKGIPRRFEIEMCKPGEPVELRHEPKNPADPRAVAVYSCRGIQIGYVTAERAPLIGREMQRSTVKAIFQRAESWGASIRVSIDGSEPVLPPAGDLDGAQWPPPGPDDADWWPDPIYDD